MGRWKATSWAASSAAGLAMLAGLGTAAVAGANPAQAARIPAATAQVKVTAKVPGQVLSVKKTRRDGFTSWAVTVQRRDGSIVVGYVDQGSGIVFDWTVQRGPGGPVVDLDGPDGALAPAKPPVTGPATGNGATGQVSAPDDDVKTDTPSGEDSGGAGQVPSAPSGGNPSSAYDGQYINWDNSVWDEYSWNSFWNSIWSSWYTEITWSSSGTTVQTFWWDNDSGSWVPDEPHWSDGSDDGADWGGDYDGGTVWVGDSDEGPGSDGGPDDAGASDPSSDAPSDSSSDAPSDSSSDAPSDSSSDAPSAPSADAPSGPSADAPASGDGD